MATMATALSRTTAHSRMTKPYARSSQASKSRKIIMMIIIIMMIMIIIIIKKVPSAPCWLPLGSRLALPWLSLGLTVMIIIIIIII